MSKKPLISVYIPTLNRKKLLERAINSVLNQTFRNFEVLVVDDGSTDGTLEYLEKLTASEQRIRLINKKGEKGASRSRNIAIDNSKGKYVTGLDDDDFFHPKRLETLLKSYREYYSAVASNYCVIDKKKSRITSCLPRKVTLAKIFNQNMLGNQVFVERKRAIEVGGYDEGLMSCQDLDFSVRLIKKYGPAKRIRPVLYFVDVSHEHERITISRSRKNGIKQFANKHRGLMSDEQFHHMIDAIGRDERGKLYEWRYHMSYGLPIAIDCIRVKLRLG